MKLFDCGAPIESDSLRDAFAVEFGKKQKFQTAMENTKLL
jgi:hypothetical protein